MAEYAKPIPVPDAATAPFWEAAHRHQLAFQRCNDCGTYAHPPVAFCRHCHNLSQPSFDFVAIRPRATLVNWAVVRDPMVTGFGEDAPWIHALGAFDDQPALTYTAALIDTEPDRLYPGLALTVTYRRITDEITLPLFTPRLNCDELC